jgi:solute carrier family 25 (mitochondrial phosphate transporter), member 3
MAAFRKVLASGGPSTFFTGWAPTFVGFFIWGGVTYALTEYLRRQLTSFAGLEAASLEVPIILCASAISGAVGSYILCPFEAVRIRSVALSGTEKTKKNVLEILNKIIEVGTLSSVLPCK